MKTGRCVLSFNSKGIVSFSPGLRGTSCPGKTVPMEINPNGVVSCTFRLHHNPFGVEHNLKRITQGSSHLATLGCVPESRWDSQLLGLKDNFSVFSATSSPTP